MNTFQQRFPANAVRKSADERVPYPSEWTPPCPTSGCPGPLHPYPAPHSSYNSVTGLDHLRCVKCGHEGMRVPNGLHLVFRGPDEYVFQYPPSLASVTIAVSPAILARFTSTSFTDTQIIGFMAEWVLLTGRATGVIRFAVETVALEDCYNYFRRHIVTARRAETA